MKRARDPTLCAVCDTATVEILPMAGCDVCDRWYHEPCDPVKDGKCRRCMMQDMVRQMQRGLDAMNRQMKQLEKEQDEIREQAKNHQRWKVGQEVEVYDPTQGSYYRATLKPDWWVAVYGFSRQDKVKPEDLRKVMDCDNVGFAVGDQVDVRIPQEHGSWWQGTVVTAHPEGYYTVFWRIPVGEENPGVVAYPKNMRATSDAW